MAMRVWPVPSFGVGARTKAHSNPTPPVVPPREEQEGAPMSQLDKTISFYLIETPNCSGQLLL